MLTITLKQHPLISEYFLHGHKLAAAKCLGVVLDPKLSFKHHIDATCRKANHTLAFIHRNLKSCHKQVKLDAYNIFIKPIFNYAATVGTPHSQCHTNKLEAIQNRAARFIVSDYRRIKSVSAIKHSLNMKSVQCQHEELRLLMLFKTLHGLAELEMLNYITPAISTTCENSIKFVLQSAQVDPYKFSFFPQSIHFWNKLQIDSTITFNDFRSLIML